MEQNLSCSFKTVPMLCNLNICLLDLQIKSKMVFLFLLLSVINTGGEQISESVDFSDLVIYDVFNDSYLAVFNENMDYSGKHFN
jgi:hypothetical protein